MKNYSLKTIKEVGQLSSDGIIVFNIDDSKIEYFNKALAKILGISKEAISAASLEKLRRCLRDNDEFLKSHVQMLLEKSKILNLELRVKAEVDKYISCDAYLLKKSSLIFCIAKDVTNSKQHSNYITEFGARKDVILDMIAQNLSGPLNMMNDLMDLIDQQSKLYNLKKIDIPARLIRENTHKCIEIINSFLREEHLASKDIYVERNRFDVLKKIAVEVARLKQFHKQKEIKVLTDKKQLFVTGDDVKFFQVIHNLLSNALKFSDIKGQITVEVIDDDRDFTISISDNGIGIPEFLQPHIFKKNTPAARAGLNGERSVGMGLYIVKKLVELMHGTLSFQSEENKGTTFTLRLPKMPGIEAKGS
jgi:two-component system, OmpR family, sensor histidine kinase VicK